MIYEERRVVLRRGALPAYTRLMLDELWPLYEAAGVRPLCLLSGLIGMPPAETYSYAGYEHLAAWSAFQARPAASPESAADDALAAVLARRAELVVEERARLLQPSGYRPKATTPVEDRRPLYGLRRFTIRRRDWPDFERYSHDGVWARIEQQDARILGLFQDAAATDPLEVTLLTGYHGPGHWEETRFWNVRPEGFSAELWEWGRTNQEARNALTLGSHVCLMNAHWPS